MNRQQCKELIQSRIAASGPAGITRIALMGDLLEWEFARVLKDLREGGHPIYMQRDSSGLRGSVYFATQEWKRAYAVVCLQAKKDRHNEKSKPRREAWYAANREKVLAKLKKQREEERLERVVSKPTKAQKPIKEKPQPKAKPVRVADTRPVSYAGALLTVAPTPKARFAVEIGPDHVSALDPQQCRPWALAAVRAATPAAPIRDDYLTYMIG